MFRCLWVGYTHGKIDFDIMAKLLKKHNLTAGVNIVHNNYNKSDMFVENTGYVCKKGETFLDEEVFWSNIN